MCEVKIAKNTPSLEGIRVSQLDVSEVVYNGLHPRVFALWIATTTVQFQDVCTDGIEEVFSFDLEKVAEADQLNSRSADQSTVSLSPSFRTRRIFVYFPGLISIIP